MRTWWYPGRRTLDDSGPQPASAPSTRTRAPTGATISRTPKPGGTSIVGDGSSLVVVPVEAVGLCAVVVAPVVAVAGRGVVSVTAGRDDSTRLPVMRSAARKMPPRTTNTTTIGT